MSKRKATLDPWVKRGAPPKPEVSKGACPHGKRPWWDCAECSRTKTYHFGGNFK